MLQTSMRVSVSSPKQATTSASDTPWGIWSLGMRPLLIDHALPERVAPTTRCTPAPGV